MAYQKHGRRGQVMGAQQNRNPQWIGRGNSKYRYLHWPTRVNACWAAMDNIEDPAGFVRETTDLIGKLDQMGLSDLTEGVRGCVREDE